jgi:lysophospholipase L1-like esterase
MRFMGNAARLRGLSIIFLLATAGCSADDGATEDEAASANIEYLALGDSIAYGENIFVPDTKEARPNGDAFVGYPDLIGPELFDGHYANLGCPGVTTASYLSLEGVDNGCRAFQEKWGNTLHVPYTGTQADKAREILQKNKVKVVTVSLGGNDLLHALNECTVLTPDDAGAALSCAIGALPQLLDDGAANLEEVVKQIREDFDGELIYVNLYSNYPSNNPATFAINGWNDRMAPLFEDSSTAVADEFAAFAAEAEAADGDPCAAGLLIPNPAEGESPACDVHPSAKGARLLADTIEAVPGFAP